MWPEELIASFASDVRKSFCHKDHRKHRGLGKGNFNHRAHKEHRGKRKMGNFHHERHGKHERGGGSLRPIRPGLDTAHR